ncbi:MAG TPA: hypothetical protein VE869_11025 [Gemmatimonas sp.]|nr:hypothetical protein [Gemmatimonas sp.]
MRTHIKIVAVANIIFSAIGLLKAFGVLFGGVFGSLTSGSLTGALVGSTVSVAMSIVVGAFAVFGLIAGFGLLNHQNWARYVAIVVALFGLFNFPFGTAFSIYTLWVLLSDESKRLFAIGSPSVAV